MPKFKQFGITVVGLLVAAGAMASNWRVADQVYLPIAGKVANFKTDVNIANVTSDTIVVTMALVQGANTAVAAPQNNFPSITLAPNERREIVDFFPTALGLASGLGQVLFNGCKQGADCTGTDTSNYRNFSVESRIYAVDANGNTSGQGFSGQPWYTYISNNQANNGTNLDKAFVVGLRQTGTQGAAGTFRTNLGFTNASQFSTTTLTAKLFNAAGAQIGSNTVTLGPLGQSQPALSNLFTGATGAGLWMTVEQTSVTPTSDGASFGCSDGCPGFFTYASVLDNVTQDPTTLESQFSVPLTPQAIGIIFPAGKVPTRAAKH